MDRDKWPVGGERLETIGNIVYGSLYDSAFTPKHDVSYLLTTKGCVP